MTDEAKLAAPMARLAERSIPTVRSLHKDHANAAISNESRAPTKSTVSAPVGRSSTSSRETSNGTVGREETSVGVNLNFGEGGGNGGWDGDAALAGKLGIQQRAAHHSELAAAIAEAEVFARALLKGLKAAHQKGADNLSSDIRFADDLITRLGAKRRWVMRKPPNALNKV